jgi:hypothetical protein
LPKKGLVQSRQSAAIVVVTVKHDRRQEQHTSYREASPPQLGLLTVLKEGGEETTGGH